MCVHFKIDAFLIRILKKRSFLHSNYEVWIGHVSKSQIQKIKREQKKSFHPMFIESEIIQQQHHRKRQNPSHLYTNQGRQYDVSKFTKIKTAWNSEKFGPLDPPLQLKITTWYPCIFSNCMSARRSLALLVSQPHRHYQNPYFPLVTIRTLVALRFSNHFWNNNKWFKIFELKIYEVIIKICFKKVLTFNLW